MRTFGQKTKATQPDVSPRTSMPVQARSGDNREMNSILHLQRTIGNQAVQRMLRARAEAFKHRDSQAHTLQQPKGNAARPPMIQRAVQIAEPYRQLDDFDPATQARKGDPALGRTTPFLNLNPQAPRMELNTFQRALNLPTLARRNFDDISKPDLSDSELDSVRARTAFVSYGQWNSKRVKLVQEALVAWGRGLDTPVQMLPAFGADGNFKNETLSAVKRFQRASSLTDDGIVGHKTLGALEKAMNDLRGSVFSLDTVGLNEFQGLIQFPPSSKSWTSLKTDQDFIFNQFIPPNKLQERADLANHFAKCPRDNQQVEIVFTDPSGDTPQKIFKHEEHHAAEQLNTIKNHLVPWDSALEALKTSGRRFRAQNPRGATAQIFAGLNIRTPCELSADIVHEWITDNAEFHSTLAGGEFTQKLESLTCTKLVFSHIAPTTKRDVPIPNRPRCSDPGQSLPVTQDIPV